MICAGAAVRKALIAADDRELLHDLSGGRRTGRQLLANVDRLAGALIAAGGTGEKIGLWYRNSLAAVEAFLAVEWVGAIRVPVDPNAAPAEAVAIFTAAGVTLVIADRTHAAALGRSSLIHEDDAPLIGPATWPAAIVEPDRTLLLYPRSVEHGRLFAIPVSYANWRATMQTNIELYKTGRYGPWLRDNECFLAAQQIMHGTGFVGTFPFLEMGLPQVLLDTFDARRALEAVERYQVTTTVLVPPMLSRLADAAANNSSAAASLRHVIYGGAPIPVGELRRIAQRLGPVLSQGYGRIEGGWPIAVLGIAEHQAILDGDDRIATSCGRPIDQVAVRLRPTASNDGPSDTGELCVSSPMTVKEYAGPDGWCSLGDVMRLNADGYLFYQGRLDRMINTGYHIYPAEIEEAITEVAGVAAVRVVGEPSREWGMSLVAYVVLTSDAVPDDITRGVQAALARRLAKYKIPRAFRIVPELPAAE